ncbi:MAG: hypothetical protein VXW30_03925 [Candidatus Thermoplasmatota archaeon]|nr:hypothetical protein [Candidatus Thermoplasmatota archaeon]
MNEIKVIQSEPGKEIIVRIVHARLNEDAWIGLFKAGTGDNEHGDRWKWMRDVDVSHITFPAQGAGEWSVRLFKDGGYDRISYLDFNISYSGSSIEILESVSDKPVRFKINISPSSNDAWVGIYPVTAGDNEHGNRWKWIRDIDVNNAMLPAQTRGRWSIRVFLDGGYTLHDRVDFDIISAHNPNMPGIMPSQTMPGQHLHDPEKAAEFALALGLMVGGHHPFVGDWQVKGLYAYRSGKYKGQAYFGTGGSESDRLKDTYDPSKPGESNQKYRPWNRDDPKIPEEIRQKLIRLEDRSSTRMNQTSQPTRNLSDSGSGLDGHYFSFKTGGNPNDIVDRFEARQDGNRVTYYRNGPVGSKSRVNSATANPMESYSISGSTLHGPVTGTIKPNGDIEYSHGYTSRKEGETTSSTSAMHIFQTGWYRIEIADGSFIERVRVHQDNNHQARNEFIATGDLTGDVKWYVEGNTVKVPKFGGTGIIQADGNITWDNGGKAIFEGNSGEPSTETSSSGTLQGEIALKSVHGKYLNATPEGRAEWDDDVAHVGEYFHVEQRQNGKIALRSAFDMYVSAQPDGSVKINSREAPPGGWEEFTVEYRSNDVVCLKSCHGKYLSAQKDGTAQWNRDHAPRGGWEEIQIEQYRKTSEPILSEPILNSDQKYVFAPEHKGWHWHNDRARAMGGHIASITSAEENEQITRISGGAPVWLGGIRKGARYRGKPLAVADRKPGDPGKVGPGAEDWYWSDGRPWSYTNWGPGEPNNWDAGENRVQHLGKFGAVWNDVGEDWNGPAVYVVPLTTLESSETSSSSSPEIDMLAQFKSKLKVSDSHLRRIDELSSKYKKK